MRKTQIPGSARGRAARTRDLLESGVPRSRLELDDVHHPHHGLVIVGEAAPAAVPRCAEYEPLLLDGQFFSHRTAAELWGLALPDARDALVDVAVAFPRTPPRRRRVAGHRVSDVVVELTHGLPVVSAADAWCQLAETLARDDLVAAGDSALPARHRTRAAALDDLVAAAGRHRHKRGAPIVAAALPLLRPGVESRMESLLRLLLRRHGLPEPVVAHPVDLGAGFLEHPDLAYPDERISIEYEGDHHRTGRGQWQRDIERYERFADAGWRVIRVTAEQLLRAPLEVVARIRAALRARRSV